MYGKSNVTATSTITQSFAAGPVASHESAAQGTRTRQASALWWCALAVLGFSFSLPATRLASGQIDPLILGPGRGAVAAVFALVILRASRARLPSAADLRSLLVVALGIVIGFPLLTAIALERVPTQHAVVMVGVMPLATSVWAVLRNGERPSPLFWVFASLGAGAVLCFGAATHGLSLAPADLYLLLAVLVCSAGYAEGGRLASQLGGVHVMCWALVLTLPCTSAAIGYALVFRPLPIPSTPAVLGFLYLSLVSSLLAFCAWYHGLALGGVARGSQVQLLQPVLSLIWCAVLLHEPLPSPTLYAGGAVLACAAGSRWTRSTSVPSGARARS
jgi:drug/metabolite transporter (DMT)-like permease